MEVCNRKIGRLLLNLYRIVAYQSSRHEPVLIMGIELANIVHCVFVQNIGQSKRYNVLDHHGLAQIHRFFSQSQVGVEALV